MERADLCKGLDAKQNNMLWCDCCVEWFLFVSQSFPCWHPFYFFTALAPIHCFSLSSITPLFFFFFLLPLIYLSVSSSLSPLDSIAVYNEWQGKRETLVWAFTTTGSVWPHTAPAIAVVTRSNTALIEWHAEGLGGGLHARRCVPHVE